MLARCTATVLAAVIVGSGLVGVPRPAHAVFFPSTQVWVNVTLNISATFNIGGRDDQIMRAIEAAKQEILAEVAASEARILEHIDNTEAARVAACIRSASQDLRNMDRYRERAERTAVARDITSCANLAGEMARNLQTPAVVDYLGYALAEINAIAAVFRASTGLDRESQLVNYIADNEAVMAKLEPQCTDRFETADPRWPVANRITECTAYNGESASHTAICIGTSCSPEPNREALKDRASANTSRMVAKEALPVLRQALARVQQGFFIAAVPPTVVTEQGVLRSGQARLWSADGPLNWTRFGNPGIPTSIATAIDAGNRRHYLAVIDGTLWHRIRNGNGSWGEWGDHGIAVSSVSAATNAQGQVHVTAIINGAIHHRIRVGEGVWTNFQPVPSQPGVATALASTVDPSGRLHLLSVVDGQLGHQMRNSDGSWTGWGSLGTAATAVSAAAQADGQVHVAAVIDGKVYHRMRHNDQAWSGFALATDLPPGARVKTVTSAIDPSGNYQLAVVATLDGFDEVYLRTRFPDGSWTAEWARLGIPEEDVFFDITAIAAS
jgi:hypothetical protein